ncbi:hypothetical protein [Peribacillus alkalitolerans]|uniref:hypothetical protein n=1 Tax=Peribacillus alkalitolerans TaxID=1550385 RepID=UPI0013D03260|nr:hypothetical protein [Peribacillus alkalitolerans]
MKKCQVFYLALEVSFNTGESWESVNLKRSADNMGNQDQQSEECYVCIITSKCLG